MNAPITIEQLEVRIIQLEAQLVRLEAKLKRLRGVIAARSYSAIGSNSVKLDSPFILADAASSSRQ